MTLWIVLTVMISTAAAALAVTLTRRRDARALRPGEAAALRADLADLDAQVAAGTLPPTTAENLRAETIRRFLGEDGAAANVTRPLGRGAQMGIAVVLAAAVALGASLIYAKLGRPDLAGPAAQPANDQDAQVADLIPQLEAKVRANPGDATGLRLLGGAYMASGRYAQAATVYRRLVAVAPQDAGASSGLGEALVRASSGTVNGEAVAAFQSAVALDARDPRARFFLALRKDQQGDHPGAMTDWIALLASAPPGAPWVAEVRSSVEQIAAEHHEDIAGRLPPETAAPEAPATPTAEQTPAARAAQQAMISGMVGRLDARLRANPQDLQGWVMLMRARMVLGDAPAAADAYRRAMAAFHGAPDDQAQLTRAADGLGVPKA